jgi:hypothetical protein
MTIPGQAGGAKVGTSPTTIVPPESLYVSPDLPDASSFLAEQYKTVKIESDNLEKELARKDGYQKLSLRIPVASFFGWLLVVQHVFVYSIVIGALTMGSLQDLQLIFTALLTGTIGETMFIIHIIVNWLFDGRRRKKKE